MGVIICFVIFFLALKLASSIAVTGLFEQKACGQSREAESLLVFS